VASPRNFVANRPVPPISPHLIFALVFTAAASFLLAGIAVANLGVPKPYEVLVATMASAAVTVIVWKGESAKARERQLTPEPVRPASTGESLRLAISLRALAELDPSTRDYHATVDTVGRSPAFAVAIVVRSVVDAISLHHLECVIDEYGRRQKGDGTHEAFRREYEIAPEEREHVDLALKCLLLVPVLEDLAAKGVTLDPLEVRLFMLPMGLAAALAGDLEAVRERFTEPLARAHGVCRTIVAMAKPDEEHGDEKLRALQSVWDAFRLGLRSTDERFVTLLAQWYPRFVRDQYRPALIAWELEQSGMTPLATSSDFTP